MKRLLLLVLSSFSILSFATIDRKGNGGDIVYCENIQSEHHLTVLDSYEARRTGRSIDFGNEGNWKSIAEDILLRWKKVAPKRAAQYIQWLHDFEEEARWGPERIEDIPDHGHVILPRGCHLEQVAMQRHDDILFPGLSRYEIDDSFWRLMSPQEQAALVLHELILREAIHSADQINSIPTRYLNGFLLSSRQETRLYFQAFIKADFPYAEFGHGAVVQNKSPEGGPIQLTPNGYPLESVTIEDVLGPIQLPHIYCEPDRPYNNNFFGARVGFTDEGFVKTIQSTDNGHFSCLPSTFRMEIVFPSEQRRWEMTAQLDPSDTPIEIYNYFNDGTANFQLNIGTFQWLVFSSDEASLSVGPGEVSIFELPEFGSVPVSKWSRGYSFFGIDDDYLQVQANRIIGPQGIEYCPDNTFWNLITRETVWHFDENTNQWSEGEYCR